MAMTSGCRDYLKTLVARLEGDAKVECVLSKRSFFGSPRWEGKLFMDTYPSREPVTFEKLLTRSVSSLFVRVQARGGGRSGGYDEA